MGEIGEHLALSLVHVSQPLAARLAFPLGTTSLCGFVTERWEILKKRIGEVRSDGDKVDAGAQTRNFRRIDVKRCTVTVLAVL